MGWVGEGEMLGRQAELAVVESALAAVRGGPLGLVVAGEAGIGKTTLWNTAVDAAGALSYQVLVARPGEAEAGLSFAGLTDLLGGVAEPVLAGLSALHRRALEVALLVAPVGEGAPPDQRTVSVATLAVLRCLVATTPVVVAVDDAQWLDRASARVLQFAVRRLGDAPVMVVMSLRTGPGAPDPLELDRALPHDRVISLALGPMSVAALHEMVAARLGLRLSHSAVVRLHRATSGNPFFALELARALKGRDLGADQALPVPDDLRALVRGRLEALSAEAADVVWVIGAAHHPNAELVEAVLGRPGSQGVVQARAAGLVVTDGDRLRLTHPLLGSTAYLESIPARRRRLHAALAAAVTEPVERARHLALASQGPDTDVAAALEVAASAAATRGAPDDAADLAEQAGTLTPAAHIDDRRRRETLAASYHARSGDLDRARRLLDAVVADSPPGRPRAQALGLLGQVRYSGGDLADAIPLLQQAVDEAGGDPELSVRAELDLAFTLLATGSLPECEPHANAALAHAERLAQPGLVAQALGVGAMVQFLTGRDLDHAGLERALHLEDRGLAWPLWMRPRFVAAMLWTWAGPLDQARTVFAALHHDLIEGGDETVMPLLSLYATHAECWAGDLAGAQFYAAAGSEVARQGGSDMARAHALTAQAHLHAQLGQIDETRLEAQEAVSAFAAGGWNLHTAWPLWALGTAELSAGNAAAVHRALGALTEMVTASGLGDPGAVPFVPDEIEALIALGQLDAAGYLLGWLDERARSVDRPWALARVGRCRALLLAASGDLDEAGRAIEAALVQHQRVAMPLERARTLLVKGQLHRRRKEKRAAKDALSEAQAVFEHAGAASWAERARQELNRVGLRPPAPLDLTATEDKVARLAADGLTTKAIGDRAFLSARTVEGVLARIYRKLGVHSRAELATVLAKRNATPPAPTTHD